MDVWANIVIGFDTALSPTNLIYCLLGVSLGTFFGMLPGIGSLAAVSMLLPITFYLEPTTALVMLAGVYYGAEYGGSTSSILLNLPGTPSNAVTCLDGYPMSQQGRAGVALFSTTIASFIGGTLGVIALYLLAPLIVRWALAFGPAEYFAIMLFGLVAAATVTQDAPAKGLAMVVLGMLLGTVGADITSGVPRFHFGFFELRDGINFIALAMGLFGVSEIILSIAQSVDKPFIQKVTLRSMVPTRDEVRRSVMPVFRGAGIGGFFGALPGTGPSIATFIGYAIEKRLSSTPERFGKGAIEGIVSPESANNAAVQAAFIPTMTLGIPGSATMAVMMGALLIHGIQPGPQLMNQNPDIFWGLAASFWIGNLLLLILNIPLIGLWVRMLKIPYGVLYPAVICFICIGVYTVRTSTFDVFLVLFFGLMGYVLRLLRFELAPILIGFILGPMVEENFKRAMLIYRGDFGEIMGRPISGTLLAMTAALLVWTFWSVMRARRREIRREARWADD
ncbi:tripartite tricarboxylate transporter permease [Roseitranquillus sediminis]|uniref:tripartite tricarboxylate transporter permease n=1 Tax=Roseitranquillus sediminis TaxID=2809051 RepID=UPI001D0C3895|nr:tripartite tricarboxylate transporter permease [Roseitranquillus sediminis]MBM9592994.1 tripartite tricarboxylate transporter permease [Roseitranquillus sediminis]